MSDYQPGPQGGWPAQPPASGDQDGYGFPQPGYQRPDYRQRDYQQPGYQHSAGQPPAERQRRRRRRRWPIVLTVLVVLILVVLAIGDQVARSFAQSKTADQIQTSAKMSSKPSVSIKGWPFLTQVASRDLKEVDISADNITASGSKVPVDFSAKATGVHLNSSFTGGTVDHITGTVTIPFASATSALGLPSGTVTLTADPSKGPNAVTLGAGPVGSLTGTVKLASPHKISLQLDSASGLASLFSGLSGGSYSFAIPTLPSGLVVQSVSVDGTGLVASASASNTTLSQ